MPREMKDCPACSGTGKCQNCNGTGYVGIPFLGGTCPRCKGNCNCKRCNGKGVVPKD